MMQSLNSLIIIVLASLKFEIWWFLVGQKLFVPEGSLNSYIFVYFLQLLKDCFDYNFSRSNFLEGCR